MSEARPGSCVVIRNDRSIARHQIHSYNHCRPSSTVHSGVGKQIVKKSNISLDVEAGLSFTSENYDKDDDDENSLGLKLSGDFMWKIVTALTFKDRLDLYPSLKESDYYLRNEAAFISALAGRWSLKLSNIIDYESDPSSDARSTDMLWLLGLQYDLYGVRKNIYEDFLIHKIKFFSSKGFGIRPTLPVSKGEIF